MKPRCMHGFDTAPALKQFWPAQWRYWLGRKIGAWINRGQTPGEFRGFRAGLLYQVRTPAAIDAHRESQHGL